MTLPIFRTKNSSLFHEILRLSLHDSRPVAFLVLKRKWDSQKKHRIQYPIKHQSNISNFVYFICKSFCQSGAMLTNYIVCNYAVAGNFVGRSVYEQVVRFYFL